MKLYKIPYSDDYYLSKDCKIFIKNQDSSLSQISEISSYLYLIKYKEKQIQLDLARIIAIVKYGYCDERFFSIEFDSSDMYNSVNYKINSVHIAGKIAMINGVRFAQSPRWKHLYANKYGVIFDIVNRRFRKHTQDRDGYIRFSPVASATNYAVHRFTYECWTHIILDKEMVIHHIDSDKSNNYFDNLELTTAAQNTRYSIINDERNLIRSFTVDDIHKMCKMMEDGKSYREIALEFNINPSDEREYKTFRSRLNILLQKKISWVDISSQYDFSNYTGNKDPNIKFSENDIKEMINLRQSGWMVKDIAIKYNTTAKYVSEILCGRKRRQLTKLFDEGSTTIESIA